jgi:hypothetical protein
MGIGYHTDEMEIPAMNAIIKYKYRQRSLVHGEQQLLGISTGDWSL